MITVTEEVQVSVFGRDVKFMNVHVFVHISVLQLRYQKGKGEN